MYFGHRQTNKYRDEKEVSAFRKRNRGEDDRESEREPDISVKDERERINTKRHSNRNLANANVRKRTW